MSCFSDELHASKV